MKKGNIIYAIIFIVGMGFTSWYAYNENWGEAKFTSLCTTISLMISRAFNPRSEKYSPFEETPPHIMD